MKQETPKLGTKEFNDLAMEMFGGKPKQQTAVEFLEEQLFLNRKPTLNELLVIKEAKEMEKEQMRSARCTYIDGVEEGEFEYWYNETFKNK
jgi:hypothetical protein